MKKIINGKVYDTEKAKLVGEAHNDRILDGKGNPLRQWFYQKKNGEFFVSAEGYSPTLGNIFQHDYKREAGIYPMTYDQAKTWAEYELTAEMWEEIFGDPEDDDSRVSVNISMTASEANTIKRCASKAGMTISAYIVSKCLDKYN